MTEQHGDAHGPETSPNWSGEAAKTIDVTPADEAQAPAGHGRRLWPVLVLVIAVVATLGTAPYWAHLLPWSQQASDEATNAALGAHDQQLTALMQQQATLDRRLAQIEQQLKSAQAPRVTQEEEAALRQLADRITLLEKRAPPAVDPQQLAALADGMKKLDAATAQLDQRLDRLEARGQAAAGTRSDQALLLALGQLRAALERGRGFAPELDTVRALGRDRPELAQPLGALEPSAAKGVPTIMSLAQSFKQEVAPGLLRAPAAPQGNSLGERIVAKLRSLVVIRRVGDAAVGSSDPVAAAVAKAEASLAGDDLAGAVAAVESLPERDTAATRSWLAQAHQRLAAEAALDQLTRSLSARLTAAPAAAPPAPAATAPAASDAAPQH